MDDDKGWVAMTASSQSFIAVKSLHTIHGTIDGFRENRVMNF